MATNGSADLIFTGGSVYTVDAARPRAEAVAVRGGEIVAVGADADVRELAGPGTETFDLGGRMLLPSFQDSHVHASGGGLERRRCDLTGVHGREAYVAAVARYAAGHPDMEVDHRRRLGHGRLSRRRADQGGPGRGRARPARLPLQP